MDPATRILVPTDFGRESNEALERAVAIARSRPVSSIDVVHVKTPGSAEAGPEALDAVRRRLHDIPPETRAEVFEREADTVVDGILAVAEAVGATFIVLGSRGGHIMQEGVAEQLIVGSAVDVLVLGHESDRRWPAAGVRILVPVDFSANAERALRRAQTLAGGDPISVLHVVDDDSPTEASAARARVAEWAGLPASKVTVRRGSPRRVVAEAALQGEFGLVVVGATGIRDVAGVMGSGVPDRLILTARAPVLVVP